MKTLLPVSILTAGMAYGLFNLFFASLRTVKSAPSPTVHSMIL
jgi:hypothetical protein